MQPFGKLIEIRNSCLCCGSRESSRARAKADLRKLINEESDNVVVFGDTVPKSEKNMYCGVCGGYDNPLCVECC